MINPKAKQSTETELKNRKKFAHLFKHNEFPTDEDLMQNLVLFLNRRFLSRILCFHEIYKLILDVPGHVYQLGVYYGRDLATFINLRSIYEPYNYTRYIIGFDTFEGFREIHEKDGKYCSIGDFSTPKGHEHVLNEILNFHELEAPLSHIKRYDLIKGDVRETLPKYLLEHDETIIAMAYFDLDLYEPTRDSLETILPYLTKGSIIVFDEPCYKFFPGETRAIDEVLGLENYRLRRFPFEPLMTYLIYE